MYKSTRHSNHMWTYSPGAIGQYAAVSENEALKLVKECKSTLLSARLLDEPDVVNLVAEYGQFGYVRLVNGRIRSGYAYLKKIGVPQSLLTTLPPYFMIAPKLGKVLARLSACRLEDLPQSLAGIHQHVERYGAPSTRPKISSAAYRVPKNTLSTTLGHAGTKPARPGKNQADKGKRIPRAIAGVAVQPANVSTPAMAKAAASTGPRKHNSSVERKKDQGRVDRTTQSQDSPDSAFAAALRAALSNAK